MNGETNFLIDTNVIIGFLDRNQSISRCFHTVLLNKSLFVSQITRMELLGYSKLVPDEEVKIQSFISQSQLLNLTDLICDKTIALRKLTRLKLPDAIILATAIIHNLTLVTCDGDIIKQSNEIKSINPYTL